MDTVYRALVKSQMEGVSKKKFAPKITRRTEDEIGIGAGHPPITACHKVSEDQSMKF